MPYYQCPDCSERFHADDFRYTFCPECGQPVSVVNRVTVRSARPAPPNAPSDRAALDPVTSPPGSVPQREWVEASAAAPAHPLPVPRGLTRR
jgi:hypothetical protein